MKEGSISTIKELQDMLMEKNRLHIDIILNIINHIAKEILYRVAYGENRGE